MVDMTQKADGTITEKVIGVTKEMMKSVIDDLQAKREAKADTRLSLEERYGNGAGYLAAVKKAAARAMAEGFLLAEDAAALIRAAESSQVMRLLK